MTKIQIVKTQDQTVLGTTLVTDNELQFHAEANTTWGLQFDLMNSSDDLADLNGRAQIAINAPMGSTVTAYCFVVVDDGSNSGTAEIQGPLVPASQGTPDSPISWGAPGTSINPAFAWVRVAASVQTGTIPGQIELRFAEFASVGDSTGCTVYAGSSLTAQRTP